MSEVAVHFAPDRMDAEVAASALRAERLHPRIAPDQSGFRFLPWSATTGGRWLVYVPDVREDNPILRLVVLVALITGLLLATPFVAQVCYGSR